MTAERSALPLRIVVEQPVPGVALALQRGASGKAALVGPAHASADALVFDFEVALDGTNATGGPRLLGPFVQGPPTARFVYLTIGASAGQIGSPWRRRAKVPLGAIDWRAIEALAPGERLTAHFNGTARGGSPACATGRSCRRVGWLGDLLRADDFEIVLADGEPDYLTAPRWRNDVDDQSGTSILITVMFMRTRCPAIARHAELDRELLSSFDCPPRIRLRKTRRLGLRAGSSG